MASFVTLLGLVLGPTAGLYLTNKLVKDGSDGKTPDTVNQRLNKQAGVNGVLAIAGYFASEHVGNEAVKRFAEGAMIGSGVVAGIALGGRATTGPAGNAALPPAKMQGLPPAAEMAGLPPAEMAGLPPSEMGRAYFSPKYARVPGHPGQWMGFPRGDYRQYGPR